MARQKTKRCHWLSQSYLRGFSADADKKKIWRLSKSASGPELKPIEKVAVKFHLYAPKRNDGLRDDSLEKKLADLERFFGDPVWAAVCNGFPDFTWEPLRKMVALLVATTYVRNPSQLDVWEKMHEQWAAEMPQHDEPPTHVSIGNRTLEVDPSDWTAFRDASKEDMKAAWNDFVGNAGEIAKMLLPMRWAVLCCDQPVFITSDNPVSIIHPSLQFKGISDPESVLHFPLSPTRILMMDNRHSEPNGAFYPLKDGPAVTNGLIWRNAIDHMFSPRDTYDVCAEILKDAELNGFA